MDPEYDTDQATDILERAYAKAQSNQCPSSPTLVTNLEVAGYQVVYVDQPRSWRLTKKGDNPEEEIFAFYGVLCESDLPPIRTSDISAIRRKATYLRQAVRLTGLGSDAFEKAVQNIEKVGKMVADALTDRKVHPWQNASYEGHSAIDSGARYFTPRRFVPQEKGLPFEQGVDPQGLLATLRGQNLIHGPDNKVLYLKEHNETGGVIRQTRASPSDFLIGDIVRATVAFVGFQTKGKDVIISVVLRALTLIERMRVKRTFTSEGCRPADRGIPRLMAIKRKRVFDDDKQAREGLERMQLCDEETD